MTRISSTPNSEIGTLIIFNPQRFLKNYCTGTVHFLMTRVHSWTVEPTSHSPSDWDDSGGSFGC